MIGAAQRGQSGKGEIITPPVRTVGDPAILADREAHTGAVSGTGAVFPEVAEPSRVPTCLRPVGGAPSEPGTRVSEDVTPQVGVVHDGGEVLLHELSIHDDFKRALFGKAVKHRLQQCREHGL